MPATDDGPRAHPPSHPLLTIPQNSARSVAVLLASAAAAVVRSSVRPSVRPCVGKDVWEKPFQRPETTACTRICENRTLRRLGLNRTMSCDDTKGVSATKMTEGTDSVVGRTNERTWTPAPASGGGIFHHTIRASPYPSRRRPPFHFVSL